MHLPRFAVGYLAVVTAASALAIACGTSDVAATPDASTPDAATQDTGVADNAVKDTGVVDSATDTGADAAVDAGPPHAFITSTNNSSDGGLSVFAMPLNPDGGSVPLLTLGTGNGISAPASVRLDPSGTKLWVADRGSNKVYAFNLPLAQNSAPVTTLTPKQSPQDLQFDAAGNLWVGEFSGTIERWASPPQGASAITVSAGNGNVFSLALDTNGVLYAGGAGIAVFSAPQTNAQTPTFTNSNFASVSGLAVIGSKLYAASYQSGSIVSFALPMTGGSTSTPVTTGGPYGWTLAISPKGDLVVPGFGAKNTVSFLTPPSFTATTVTVSVGLADPRGVAFGN